MALGWVDVTVDAGDTPASPCGCYRSDVVSRPQWQGRSFWRVRRPLLSAYHVAVERLRLDPVISADCSVCTGGSGRCNEYVDGRGCFWRWKRRCRPEHDLVMGSGWRHVDTTLYGPVAARARRRWHGLRRGLRACDSLRRSG